jgi:hypothetical protein
MNIQKLFNINDDGKYNLEDFLKLDYVEINKKIIDDLKDGLIIADEIHNVYNSLDVNNYGLAIQYLLDNLGDSSPRTVYMSATPVTGNASEVVDLLNLLNPNLYLNRNDFFYKNEDDVYDLKPNALSTISKLVEGKVSYLLDTNKVLYPTRIFLGDDIEQIPYIKLNVCKLSDYFQKAVDHEIKTNNIIGLNSVTLYDCVFPNPFSEDIGLYSDVANTLSNANSEWKQKTGLNIYTNSDNATIITGDFLHKDNLKQYSEKYYNVLMDILTLLKNKKEGKIMIYHHKVQISGVLLLQEIFKMNGFIDDISDPNPSTLCVICGNEYRIHTETNHTFKPCRFIMAHSKLNKNTLKKNMIKFNHKSNLYGTEYKLIIGSRIIREGLNFTAIRWQYILSLPINFPILIQVLGRVVRKGSHIDLPVDQQNVYIKIYANKHEIPRYILKAKEYLIIQKVEKALRINAIDNFIHYKSITREIDSLESLAFTPANIEKNSITTKYFDAYNYNNEEIILIKKLIFLLFRSQPIWTYDDLWEQIHHISNINYNINLLDKGNFDIALYQCPNIDNINNAYYIINNNNQIPDIEYYYRKNNESSHYTLNLSSFLKYNKDYIDFAQLLKEYLTDYFPNNLELSLIDFPYSFHIELLKKLILNEVIVKQQDTIINVYKRFKILVFLEHKVIGYVDKISIKLYDNDNWIDKSLEEFEIGQRFVENDVIIGYTEDNKFKLREVGKRVKTGDLRAIKKGAVCTTYSQNELKHILNKLRSANNNNKNYAYHYDTSIDKKLSIAQLCTCIKLYLLHFEEKNRSTIHGMKNSIRWLYLFNETLPAVVRKE